MEQCFECGNPATENHHVIPKSLGGTKTVPLCTLCHMKVHGLDKTRRAENHVENTKRGLNAQKDLIKKQGYFISKAGRRVEKLGTPFWKEEDILKGSYNSAKVRTERLKSNPAFVQSYNIAKLMSEKGMKNEIIADELNRMGLRTPKGFLFLPSTISRLIIRGNKFFKTNT
jgi:hypothetical protein